MGFKPSPYNSIRMYLVTEEIIWGNRHDPDNAFQYRLVWAKKVLLAAICLVAGSASFGIREN
jgi:hypothetical protein